MAGAVKALIDEYGSAVAARVAAAIVAGASPLLEAAKEREIAARQALDTCVFAAAQLVSEAMTDVEKIDASAPQKYSDDPSWGGSKQNFERGYNARRKFSLKDAKPLARYAAKQLRKAWDILEPTQ